MASGDYLGGQITSLVQRVALGNGYALQRDVLVDMRVKTADLPYVFIDRHGLLIVDVEYWPSSTISGTSNAESWSARSSSLGKAKFENPCRANRERCDVLREALVVCGRRLASEYFTSVVVFVGADISRLKLEPIDQAKVVDARQFEQWVRDLADFPPNEGILESHEVDDLASLLRALNRSDNDEVRARHQQSKVTPGSRAKATAGEVALADTLTGVAPTAPRLSPDRYPTLSAAPVKRATSAVALLLVLALAVWLFAYGGYAIVSQRLAFLTTTAEPTTVANPPSDRVSGASAPDTMLAQKRLAEAAPQLIPKIADIDSPRITTERGVTVYTWEYVEQANGVARVGSFSLGLNAEGNVVHVNQQ